MKLIKSQADDQIQKDRDLLSRDNPDKWAMAKACESGEMIDVAVRLLAHIDDQQAAIDALRKHAEALLKTLIVIREATKEEGSRWAASEAVNTYCTAYPKEESDAESAV